MAITLYDSTVGSFLQTLGAVDGFLAKGLAHCKEKNIDPNEIVEARLIPDMLPFRFQVVGLTHHSAGALAGAQAGAFKPSGPSTADYAGLLSTFQNDPSVKTVAPIGASPDGVMLNVSASAPLARLVAAYAAHYVCPAFGGPRCCSMPRCRPCRRC